jgi:UDP-glucose 4-epimerase
VRVLVTGGAGYIGSHTCLQLIRAGHEVYVVDSLYNGHAEAIERVRRLTNYNLGFTECDVRDAGALNEVFTKFQPEAVIHFAGLKAVGESVAEPARYYEVNVGGTAVLLGAMERAMCDVIVFSSSATVYGEPRYLPYDEAHPTKPVNPYGRTRLAAEQLLRDWSAASVGRHAVALRYFNPVGADASGEIGEDPRGVPNNLMPFIAQVAVGRRAALQVFGDDYDTRDGTGERDYIHITDLALAHVAAVERTDGLEAFEAINVGCGVGVSVLELVDEFRSSSGADVPIEIVGRRPGDLPAFWADAKLAEIRLDWKALSTLRNMCLDTWRWQLKNPNGFEINKDLES